MRFLKNYWDLIWGAVVGAVLCIIAHIELERIQLFYSIIILFLVSIGFFRTIRQAIDKQRNARKHTMIDSVVDTQQAIKALSLAQNPTKEGEKIGKIFIKIMEVLKNTMNKFKKFFEKFKGIVLAIALGILTIVEGCGGYINDLFGGGLVINGVEVLPLVTLVASIVVGIISDGWTKEQREKIKALFSKSSTNEIVQAEIKKKIKENEAKVKEFKVVLTTKKTELDNLNSEMETKVNTLSAKREMSTMTPQLATALEVQLAEIAVNDIKAKIAEKGKESAEVETTIANLNSTISALKTQL